MTCTIYILAPVVVTKKVAQILNSSHFVVYISFYFGLIILVFFVQRKSNCHNSSLFCTFFCLHFATVNISNFPNQRKSKTHTAIFSATFCAVLPLIPVSISSKIKVSVSSLSAIRVLIASIILESSPPDTTLDNSLTGSPGLVEIKKQILSFP